MSMYGDNVKSHVYDDIRDMIRTGDITFNDLIDIVKDIYENKIESERYSYVNKDWKNVRVRKHFWRS